MNARQYVSTKPLGRKCDADIYILGRSLSNSKIHYMLTSIGAVLGIIMKSLLT